MYREARGIGDRGGAVRDGGREEDAGRKESRDAGALEHRVEALVGDTLFFFGADATGRALWKLEGAVATKIVPFTDQTSQMTAAGGKVFFVVTKPGSNELWRSDGTADGTKKVNAGFQLPSPALTSFAGFVFFPALDIRDPFAKRTGFELWRSDGTDEGTAPVGDIMPGPVFSAPTKTGTGIVGVGDTLYFSPDDGTDGIELWSLLPEL